MKSTIELLLFCRKTESPVPLLPLHITYNLNRRFFQGFICMFQWCLASERDRKSQGCDTYNQLWSFSAAELTNILFKCILVLFMLTLLFPPIQQVQNKIVKINQIYPWTHRKEIMCFSMELWVLCTLSYSVFLFPISP